MGIFGLPARTILYLRKSRSMMMGLGLRKKTYRICLNDFIVEKMQEQRDMGLGLPSVGQLLCGMVGRLQPKITHRAERYLSSVFQNDRLLIGM